MHFDNALGLTYKEFPIRELTKSLILLGAPVDQNARRST